MFRALEKGQLQAIWIAATNPAVSLPDLHHIRRALGRARLVVVSDAYHPTETSLLADVVLPAALWGEITLKTTILEMPDPPPKVGAGELTRLRIESGMSQAVFAQVLNVSTKTVQSWEQGTRRPSRAALRLIQVFRRDTSGVLQAAGMPGLAATRTSLG